MRFLGTPLGSAAALCTSPLGPYQKCSTSAGSCASFDFNASSSTTADGRLSSAVQKATGHLVRVRVRTRVRARARVRVRVRVG